MVPFTASYGNQVVSHLPGEASCTLKLKRPWGPAKQLNSYLSRRQSSLGWGTGRVQSPSTDELLPKHAPLAQISIIMCPLIYWKVPMWAVWWPKSQSVSTRKPNLTQWCWNLMRLLRLQFHSQVLPGQNTPEQRRAL